MDKSKSNLFLCAISFKIHNSIIFEILNRLIEDLLIKYFLIIHYLIIPEKNNDDIISFFKHPKKHLFNKINNDIINNLSFR